MIKAPIATLRLVADGVVVGVLGGAWLFEQEPLWCLLETDRAMCVPSTIVRVGDSYEVCSGDTVWKDMVCIQVGYAYQFEGGVVYENLRFETRTPPRRMIWTENEKPVI